MIKDLLSNSNVYENLFENLKIGFDWLKNTDFNLLEDGRHSIKGDDIFANVQTYETKDVAPFEAHRKYVDIQYMISGRENVEVANYTDCVCDIDYDLEKDIEFLKKNTSSDKYSLNQGEFLVFFPHDAHKPALNLGEKKIVRKVIVKVAK